MVRECMRFQFPSNLTDCPSQSYEQCARPMKCPSSGPDNQEEHCFAVWNQDSIDSEPKILSSGCHPPLSSSLDECGQICESKRLKERQYCCCTENFCNKKESLRVAAPSPIQTPTAPPIQDNRLLHPSNSSSQTLVFVFGSCIIAIILIIIFIKWYKSKRKAKNNNNHDRPHTTKFDSKSILTSIVNGQNTTSNGLNELDEFLPKPFYNTNNNLHTNNNTMINDHNNRQHLHHHQQTTVNFNNNDNQNIPRNSVTPFINDNLQDDPLQRQSSYHQTNQNDASSERIDLNSIKLLEVVGSGRFGTVHRAELEGHDSDIAVKIIQASEEQSWHNELQIYRSFMVKHPNILNYLGWSQSVESNCHWLIVEYAPKGSLYSFLNENTVTWPEFLRIALGVSQGLSHLHDIDIAHRDFKSKNVLLKEDLTPCITDFGVALILNNSSGSKLDHRKKYLQVGTPRYMAPEVLECSVLFTNASFKKIDVYALSLVVWEIASRCHSLPLHTGAKFENHHSANHHYQHQFHQHHHQTGGDQNSDTSATEPESATVNKGPKPYRLPFDDNPEIGKNPDINTMRRVVNTMKYRPQFQPEWASTYPMSAICRLCTDGWEYDYDARISAPCFVERLQGILQATTATSPL